MEAYHEMLISYYDSVRQQALALLKQVFVQRIIVAVKAVAAVTGHNNAMRE